MNDTITFNTETQLYTRPTPNFKCSGYGLGAMIAQITKPSVLEIGCDIGDTTQFLLDSNPECYLIGVDPYENYVDWNGNNLNEREAVYERFMNRLKGYSNRFNLIRKYSDDAAATAALPDFDVVFIDGLHTYEQLTKDCASFYHLVKPGGIFAGHDFTAIEGVNRAAKEFALSVGKEILTTESDVWYWIK